jgi:hypothetical protein
MKIINLHTGSVKRVVLHSSNVMFHKTVTGVIGLVANVPNLFQSDTAVAGEQNFPG